MREKTFDKKEKNALDGKTKTNKKKNIEILIDFDWIFFVVADGLNVKVEKNN